MKSLLILSLYFIAACTSPERPDWDSGAEARDSYIEEMREEEVENTQNQFPGVNPQTEEAQPF